MRSGDNRNYRTPMPCKESRFFCALTVGYDIIFKNPDVSFVVLGNGGFLFHVGILFYLQRQMQIQCRENAG